MPLNRITPGGHTETFTLDPADAKPVKSGSTVDLRDNAFSPVAHLACTAGGKLTLALRRRDPPQRPLRLRPAARRQPHAHDGQTYTTRFALPGHYELFCYLHPMTMHETVEVTPGVGAE